MKKQSLNHTSIQKLEEYKNSLAQNGNITLVIRIHPGSKNTAWKEMMSDWIFKLGISSLPVDGKANQELIKFLSTFFWVSRSAINIIRGQNTREKTVTIQYR